MGATPWIYLAAAVTVPPHSMYVSRYPGSRADWIEDIAVSLAKVRVRIGEKCSSSLLQSIDHQLIFIENC